jgi:hypothetical protein
MKSPTPTMAIKVTAAAPGFTATDLDYFQSMRSAEDAARAGATRTFSNGLYLMKASVSARATTLM